jgi:1,4-alpha-glucan branching enzyme
MKECNEHCYRKFPGITMIAEESTAWGGVSKPTHLNGLGYGYKWNMGWMNDSLRYMQQDPVYRKYSHQDATFSMIYAFDENFILVLSHDEVVHGKGSLINKMPGDRWQKFANLRMFYAWMWSHPGKKLLFMGCEFAQWEEWKESKSLDWHLFLGAEHAGMQRLIGKLNELYLGKKALSELDHEPGGFEWIEGNDAENSIFVYERKGKAGQSVYVIVNATPVERRGYRVGVNELGQYHVMLNTDALEFGGAGLLQHGHLRAEKQNWQGRNQSLLVDIPALATVWLEKM